MVSINTTMIWEVANFLVLLWLLKRYLYGPLTEMLDKRSQKIEGDLDEAREKREEAKKLKAEAKKELQKARNRAQEIVEEAEGRGQERAQEIIEEAKQEAERIKQRNKEEIVHAKEEAVDQLRNEVASISLMAASKFMKEKLDQKRHQELINQYIEDLDEKKLGEAK